MSTSYDLQMSFLLNLDCLFYLVIGLIGHRKNTGLSISSSQ